MICGAGLASRALAATLDDFSDTLKAGWLDFAPSSGAIVELNGQFQCLVPALAGPPSLVGSAKVSQTFTLDDGRAFEFRVDVVSTTGADAFAVLAWTPTMQPLAALAGYFIAQSGREVRVGKSVNRYFYRQAASPPLKNQNVTLVLGIAGAGTNVLLHAQVLDKDANDAVLFDRTFTDTPGADPLAGGADSPAAPWSGAGNYALFGYSELEGGVPDTRVVNFANAMASAPGESPTLWVADVEFTNHISFLSSDLLSLEFGQGNTDARGQVQTYHLSVTGFLVANSNYVISLGGASGAASPDLFVQFDTFCARCPTLELEDYNFGGGHFLDAPDLAAEGTGPWPNSYSIQQGVAGVDYRVSALPAPPSPYRPGDGVPTHRSLDYYRPKFAAAGGRRAGIFDYDVFGLQAGDYLVYTRTFPEANYAVYLREAVVNVDQTDTVLERVVGPPGTNQTVTLLGHFLGTNSGFAYWNVPLTDTAGNPVSAPLDGQQTLRLRQVSPVPRDAAIYQNYLVFVPPINQCAASVLESSAQVAGPYALEGTAVQDTNRNTITVQRPLTATRFYRMVSPSPTKILSIKTVGDGLTLQYGPP